MNLQFVAHHRCNPWGFLQPVLQDGSSMPATGLADRSVRLADVARPVLDNMFLDSPLAGSEGLLLSLDFGRVGDAQTLTVGSTWTGPPLCTSGRSYGDACGGCSEYCTFGGCLGYSGGCMQRALVTALTSKTVLAGVQVHIFDVL